MNKNYEKIVSLVCDTLVEAGSTFREDKKKAYKRVIASEDNERAKWVLETVLANAEAAEKNHSPLCDDTAHGAGGWSGCGSDRSDAGRY